MIAVLQVVELIIIQHDWLIAFLQVVESIIIQHDWLIAILQVVELIIIQYDWFFQNDKPIPWAEKLTPIGELDSNS